MSKALGAIAVTGAAAVVAGITLKTTGRYRHGERIAMAGGAALAGCTMALLWQQLAPDTKAILADPAAKPLVPGATTTPLALAERQAFVHAHRAVWADPSWITYVGPGEPHPKENFFTEAIQEERMLRTWDNGPQDERIKEARFQRAIGRSLAGLSTQVRDNLKLMGDLMANQAVRCAADPVATRKQIDDIFYAVDHEPS